MQNKPTMKILQDDINQQPSMQDMIQAYIQNVIQLEFDKFIGASSYERTASRTGQRNGHYERYFTTRVGTIKLQVCRDRDGKFSPSIFEKYQRSEKALVNTIIEMYFSGVSTRKVTKMTQELCGFDVSKSQVSELVKTLDENLHAWRNRLLTEKYTYIIFDARYEKVRENGHVVSKAFIVAIGITEAGMREVIGCFVVDSESESAWSEAINNLKDRGLHDVKFVVSDDNKGLKAALSKHFQGVLIQRCQVHFMRNFMAKLSSSNRAEGIRLLQDVFAATTKEDAIIRTEKLRKYLISINKGSVADWIDEHVEESLTVLALPREHHKQMKSTNMLERLNQELKRRSRCIRIFPNVESCIRLLGVICQEISEEWTNKRYLNMEI